MRLISGHNTAETRHVNMLKAKRWREAHPERHRANSRKAQIKRMTAWRAFMAQVKGGPCSDCGVCYPPCVMDFDHVRGTKTVGVGHFQAISPAALAEIAKCDLVCSNCHRIRTNSRLVVQLLTRQRQEAA